MCILCETSPIFPIAYARPCPFKKQLFLENERKIKLQELTNILLVHSLPHILSSKAMKMQKDGAYARPCPWKNGPLLEN